MALHISILNVFLSIVILLHNWKINWNSVYLSLLLFLISTFSIGHYLVLHATEPFWLAVVFNNYTPIWCLTGPCLYIYTRGVLTDRSRLKIWDLVHTIPFWITLAGVLPYLLSPFAYKLNVAEMIIHKLSVVKDIRVNWLIPQPVNQFIRPVLLISYALACLWSLIRFKQKQDINQNHPARQFSFVYRWLVALAVFVLAMGIYYVSVLIVLFLNPEMERRLIYENQAIYFIGVVLIFLPFTLLLFPELLYGIPKYPMRSISSLQQEHAKALPARVEDKGAGSPAADMKPMIMPEKGDAPFQLLGQELIAVMDEKKPYLRDDFSLDDLAELLNVPKHHLYYVFRNILNTRFTTLRTEYRIAHAKKLLLVADLRKITLDALARDCGFASRSGFYKTFREEVGCSPGEFLENCRNGRVDTIPASKDLPAVSQVRPGLEGI